MKYHFCVKRPKEGDVNNEVVKMVRVLLKGGTVHWGKRGQVVAFTEPLHSDGTPAVELGYLNMLVKAPLMDYLRDKKRLGKITVITKGWTKIMKGKPKIYPRA